MHHRTYMGLLCGQFHGWSKDWTICQRERRGKEEKPKMTASEEEDEDEEDEHKARNERHAHRPHLSLSACHRMTLFLQALALNTGALSLQEVGLVRCAELFQICSMKSSIKTFTVAKSNSQQG
jgi:hypothetical protein